MTQKKGPNNNINRACQRIRQACAEIHSYRSSFPIEITAQRDSMFREDHKFPAAYETADVALHLLQYVRRQLGSIKAPDQTEKNKE